MFWLKVGHEFYNLDCIVKIDYYFEGEGSTPVVNIYSNLSVKPLQLNGEQAALFLYNISHMEGCWAFKYPDEDVSRINKILKKEPVIDTSEEVESKEESYSFKEKSL